MSPAPAPLTKAEQPEEVDHPLQLRPPNVLRLAEDVIANPGKIAQMPEGLSIATAATSPFG